MLTVMTLDHCPSQRHCSFGFVANFEEVLSFDYYSYFPHLYYHHYFHYLPFYFLLLLSILVLYYYQDFSISFSLSLVYFVCYFYVVVGLSHVSDKKTLYCLFFMSICFLLLTLNKYILHRCTLNII